MVALATEPTRIVRAPKGEHPYFMMARQTAQDKELSWAARGMLSYLLSKPNFWVVQPTDLQQGCGRDKVYSILKELHEAHYLSKKQIFDDQHRTQGWEYQVHEIPFTEKTEMESEPQPENPCPEIPCPENPHLDIKESLENKDSIVPAKQDTITPTPLPDAPKDFRYLCSAESDSLTHLIPTASNDHGARPLCKRKVPHRVAYNPINAKPPCTECWRIAEEKSKPKPRKPRPERKPLPWDVLTDSICTHLLGAKDRAGISASAWRAGKIIHGDKSRPEIMCLTDYEYERQKVITLDYAALAKDVPNFVAWYRTRCPGCDLKDAGKFMEYWQEWRGINTPVSDGKPFYIWIEKEIEPGIFKKVQELVND